MMATAIIRVAPENELYRLVEKEDIVPGAEIFLINDGADPFEFEEPYKLVKLEDPVFTGNGNVRYYQGLEKDKEWAFVPVAEFTGMLEIPGIHHYWIRIEPGS